MIPLDRLHIRLFLFLATTSRLLAADIQFNVASGDWQTAGNWSPATVPGSPDFANVNQGRTVTINSGTGTVATSGDPLNHFSLGGNQNGALAGNGSAIQTGGEVFSAWTRMGRGAGNTGTYTLSAGTLNAGVTGGGLFVGGENDQGTGYLNMSGGRINAFGAFRVGHINTASSGTSRGTMTMSAGTVASSADILVGHREAGSGQAQGTFNLSGGTVTAPQFRVGVSNGGGNSFGTLDMSGGVISVSANGFRHGQGGGTAVLNLTGGTVNQTTGHAVFGDGGGSRTTADHGGTFVGNYFQFVVGHNTAYGTYNLSNGTMNITNNDFHVGRQGGTGVLNQTGGVINNSNGGTSGSLHIGFAGNSRGTYNLSGGTLNFRQLNIGNSNATDQGWFNHSGGAISNQGVGNSWISVGSSNSGSGTWTATAGTLNHSATFEVGYRTNTSGILTIAGTADYSVGALNMSGANPGLATLSRFNLEGGTFRTDTITLAHTATEFNWGSGVLGLRTSSGTLGGTDLSLGTSNSPFVAHGRQLTFQQGGYGGTGVNETIFTGSGINASGLHAAGGASHLELGGLYLSAGTRFNKAVFNDGLALDASAAGDVLSTGGTAYLLRPFGFFTEDYGSLPLVQFNGGGSLIGTFDTFIGLGDDGRGFSQFTGVFTSASALPLNTWFLEQTASGVNFHYKVAGFVPEPDTFALLAMSALGLRTARTLRDRHRRFLAAATD
jgi:hypothetical protein